MDNKDEVVVETGTEVATTSGAGELVDLGALNKSLEGIEGVTIGDIGIKVARVPIEKYKASTQKTDRISFITKKVIAVKTHYIENAGSILCFGKECCKMGGFPSVRYLFPVVVYSTDSEGNIIGKKLDLKILSAGEDLYKSIITINRATAEHGGIDGVDLMVTCTDDKYQKITLNQAGKAAWKKSQQAVNFVTEKWSADAEYAYMAVARKVDSATFLQLIGAEGEGGVSMPAQKFDENNTDLGSFFND